MVSLFRFAGARAVKDELTRRITARLEAARIETASETIDATVRVAPSAEETPG